MTASIRVRFSLYSDSVYNKFLLNILLYTISDIERITDHAISAAFSEQFVRYKPQYEFPEE